MTGWRVGRHQPRNVYQGDRFVAVCVGCESQAQEDAGRIVDAMNRGSTVDVPMLYRVGGPAWKAIGLATEPDVDGVPTISRGKALQVLRDLATGSMTEEQVEAWVKEFAEPLEPSPLERAEAEVRAMRDYLAGLPSPIMDSLGSSALKDYDRARKDAWLRGLIACSGAGRGAYGVAWMGDGWVRIDTTQLATELGPEEAEELANILTRAAQLARSVPK